MKCWLKVVSIATAFSLTACNGAGGPGGALNTLAANGGGGEGTGFRIERVEMIGVVRDLDGNVITDATIFDESSGQVATTNSAGEFNLNADVTISRDVRARIVSDGVDTPFEVEGVPQATIGLTTEVLVNTIDNLAGTSGTRFFQVGEEKELAEAKANMKTPIRQVEEQLGDAITNLENGSSSGARPSTERKPNSGGNSQQSNGTSGSSSVQDDIDSFDILG